MNVLLLFTFDKSLKLWDDLGIFKRETSLYKKLSKKGIQYKFITYGDEKDFDYSHSLSGIKIIPVKYLINSKYTIIKLLKSFFLSLKLKNELHEVDIIKTNQVMGSWVAFLAKILYRKKLIIRAGYPWFRNYISGVYFDIKKNYIKYLLNYIYTFIIEFIAYKLADNIIITSDSDKDFIIKTFKLKNKIDQIRVISNFINTDLFKPIVKEKKDKHVLRVGRLDKGKNLFNLLRAFKNLNNFKLDLIGSGPYEKYLKKFAKKLNINVKFLGLIPNDELPNYINQYDIFILPSSFEGNPKVLLEAMSCGLACIGTDVKGINNVITHLKNGYLCNTDADSISQAILKIYHDSYLREKIGNNAREYILRNCSLDSVIEKEFLIYKEILKLRN